MEEIGILTRENGHYQLAYPALGLVVRGPHAEWVLEAAAEVIAETEKLRADSQIEELTALVEFGEAEEIEIDAAKYDASQRFEIVPQCHVVLGSIDYHWISPAGRSGEEDGHLSSKLRRLFDMSRTRNDSFLRNEDPNVNTAG
jgi:hypothetical protein